MKRALLGGTGAAVAADSLETFMTKQSGKKPTPRRHMAARKPAAHAKSVAAAPRTRRRPDGSRSEAHDSEKSPPVQTKQSQVIALMQREDGASLAELIDATHWQPHSVRGVISGILRKKLGLNVTCTSLPESGENRYRIIESATTV